MNRSTMGVAIADLYDLSQRTRNQVHPGALLVESNLLEGTALERVYAAIKADGDIDVGALELKGCPPLGYVLSA